MSEAFAQEFERSEMSRFKPSTKGILSAGACWALLAVTIQVALAGTAAAQLLNLGPIQLETDRNVADGNLGPMLPSAGVRSRWKHFGGLTWRKVHTISLFAVTKRGISTRFWDSEQGSWSDWDHLGDLSGAPIDRIPNSGDDPGLDYGLPIARGWGQGEPDYFLYQGEAEPSSGSLPSYELGVMEVDAPAGTIAYAGHNASVTTAGGNFVPSGWDYFNPQTTLESIVPGTANTYRRHVFGTGLPRNFVKHSQWQNGPDLPLVEYREIRTGATSWFDHGVPDDHTGVTVGSGSAVSVLHDYQNFDDPAFHEEQKYVFVATDPLAQGDEGINGSEIAFLQGAEVSGGNIDYQWHSLGSPAGAVYGAPLATTYYTGVPAFGGKGRIVVFAVAQSDNGDFELHTQWHTGLGWDTRWTNHGAPPELNGGKFKMTSSVVWYNGASNDMANLRISAFGYSEVNGSTTGGLVEFHWNGGRWSFRPVRFAPGGRGLRVEHAVVADGGSTDRVVAFVRTYDGRIYEDVQEFRYGHRQYQIWNDLSTEPIVVAVPPYGSFRP